MKPSLCRLLLVAALSLVAGTLPAKTLNVLLLANASTQDVIQKLIREYQQQNPDTDFKCLDCSIQFYYREVKHLGNRWPATGHC